jgi:PhnB protein
MPRGELCYLQIPADDVEISARFYERVFGWSVEPPGAGFEAPGLIGQWITDRPASPESGPVGWITVPDVEGALADAVAAGARLRMQPTLDGPRVLASFLDPAGNLVGIVQHHDHAPPGAGALGRIENRTMPPSTVIPQLTYDDVIAAIDWLCDKFGFVERWRAGDHRAQLSIGNGTVAITEPRTSDVRPGPRDILVRIEDAAGHCERARARGATIVSEPRDYPYGERQYTAEDLGGHHWCFSQSIADVAPEEWGGTAGPALQAAVGPSISVMLIVPDAEAAIAWYYDALGAELLWNLGGVAALHVAGAPFFVHEINPGNPSETSPHRAGVTSTRIELFVEDPDAVLERAIAAGATPGSPVVDHKRPWGAGTHRQGGFRDPFGHNWSVGDRSPLSA